MYIQTGTVDCPSGYHRCFRSDDREFSGCALLLQQEGGCGMNIRVNKKILLSMGVSLIMIVLAGAILTFGTPSRAMSFISLGLIVAGLLMFAISLHPATKPETELVADERVTRINEKAGNSAFWLVLLSITILFWSDRAWSIGVELVDMYYATMVIGTISWSILRWHYSRKGDVI